MKACHRIAFPKSLLNLMLTILIINSYAMAKISETLRQQFSNPPTEFTQMPFWFWNDNITPEGIRQQLLDFKAHGVYGVIPHARMGLSENIGYLTEEWLDLIEVAAQLAESLDMKICLYDEGMYPSGCAHGEVVRQNPEFASQGLCVLTETFDGPGRFAWKPKLTPRQKFVALVAAEMKGDTVMSRSLIELKAGENLEAPPGKWQLMAFVQTPSGGHIRGVHFGEDDGQENAPPSADLLNPEATEWFIKLTHERYFNRLKQHFGRTVIGMFTDEPSLLGRGAQKGLKPWTNDFLAFWGKFIDADPVTLLPLLFFEADDASQNRVRQQYQRAIQAKLMQSYYQPLSTWCQSHQIALTGHPAEPDDMLPLHYFQLPGQDIVWRWVLPGKSALEGEQSTNPKCASSIARHHNRRWVLNEYLGAYGWQLTPAEMKWLTDWLMVRGTNLLVPHAFYYSLAGDRRYERPPDVGPNNLWWQQYQRYSCYTNRLSWLLTDSKQVCECAVAAVDNQANWHAAKILFQNQIDFNFIDEATFESEAQIDSGALKIGPMAYKYLIFDQPNWKTSTFASRLDELLQNHIYVFVLDESAPGANREKPCRSLQLKYVNEYHLPYKIPHSVKAYSEAADLRVLHLVKSETDFYLLTNEGERLIETKLELPTLGSPEIWDAETGAMKRQYHYWQENGRTCFSIKLHPCQSKIIVFDKQKAWPKVTDTNLDEVTDIIKEFEGTRVCGSYYKAERLIVWNPDKIERTSARIIEAPPIPEPIPLTGKWTLTLPSGGTRPMARLHYWTDWGDLKKYSGSLTYACLFQFPDSLLEDDLQWLLEVNGVREYAEAFLNGSPLGLRLWQPFEWDLTSTLRSGENLLELKITNTRANELTKDPLPSGLQGPLRLIPKRNIEIMID
ncbi:hypothetical protein JXJ21_19830 [candidate division KSB1 bacterium]|nr:hypothetical protein [candidate division KSB1 bacterium]